ncbi:UNVERIFIED_CONTAM: Zinc finger CCCH domain-containing protein 11 [Sesamum calycinum]|uniref:Zinc finger CCCH domain-containing protein 11 n=1 Tax=Sesamum calycinum TaxID=2727403 RepID=A0AAW2NTN3_9LAMI
MPPKQQSKADLAKKQKVVEDKTFGLKNKNKSKNVQKYVQSLKQSVQPKPDPSKLNAQKKKEEEKAREKELNELFKVAIKQPKVPVDMYRKSLCIFRQWVCKYFLEAVEKKQYGWFWICPNGGKECHYRHALPPGYVLKSQMKALLEEESLKIPIEEEIENQEIIFYSLILLCQYPSGRELFLSDASLFVDDAEAYDRYQREEEVDAEQKMLSIFGCRNLSLNLLCPPLGLLCSCLPEHPHYVTKYLDFDLTPSRWKYSILLGLGALIIKYLCRRHFLVLPDYKKQESILTWFQDFRSGLRVNNLNRNNLRSYLSCRMSGEDQVPCREQKRGRSPNWYPLVKTRLGYSDFHAKLRRHKENVVSGRSSAETESRADSHLVADIDEVETKLETGSHQSIGLDLVEGARVWIWFADSVLPDNLILLKVVRESKGKSEDVSKVLLKIFRKNLFLSWGKAVKLQIWSNDEEEEAEPLQAIDSQGNPIEKEQEEEIRFLLEGIDFEELGGMRLRVMVERTVRGGLSLRVMGDKTGVELGVDDNFIEIPIQQEDSNKTDNVTENVTDNITENVTEIPIQNITEKGKRKLYERFLNESSSEFDDSSDEDMCNLGVLRDWCIRNGVDLEFLRNEAARVTAKCKLCEWRIHASPIQGGPTFQIKTIKVACAVGRDGNDNMFPIAMAVVQVENRDTWAIGSKRARLDDYVDFYTKLQQDEEDKAHRQHNRLHQDLQPSQMLLFMKKSNRDLKPPSLEPRATKCKGCNKRKKTKPTDNTTTCTNAAASRLSRPHKCILIGEC